MDKERKEKILTAARNLFNELGYNRVTMRNIADALGISVGNVTYYFKRKEDLAEAIIVEQHKHYKKPKAPDSLSSLHQYFVSVIEYHKENQYYFRDYTQMARLSKKVSQIQKETARDWSQALTEALDHMTEKQIFQKELFSGQRTYFIAALRIQCIYGNELFEFDKIKLMWSMIYPQLTEKGQKVFDQEIGLFVKKTKQKEE